MINWTLEMRCTKNLSPHPSNPRKLTKIQYDQLKTSIDKFGLIDKVIVNLDNVIIGGHQRYHILKKEKVKEVPCLVPDRLLNNDEVLELMCRLNRNHGSFDYEILANEFDIPDLIEWGFTIEELEINDTAEEVDPKEESKKKQCECPNCGYLF